MGDGNQRMGSAMHRVTKASCPTKTLGEFLLYSFMALYPFFANEESSTYGK